MSTQLHRYKLDFRNRHSARGSGAGCITEFVSILTLMNRSPYKIYFNYKEKKLMNLENLFDMSVMLQDKMILNEWTMCETFFK